LELPHDEPQDDPLEHDEPHDDPLEQDDDEHDDDEHDDDEESLLESLEPELDPQSELDESPNRLEKPPLVS
jgi:hypothetical protein